MTPKPTPSKYTSWPWHKLVRELEARDRREAKWLALLRRVAAGERELEVEAKRLLEETTDDQ